MKARVLIETDRVIKTGDPATMAFEVEKMQAAFELGHRSGLFTAPEVLEFEAGTGKLTMSRLHDLTPLRALPGTALDPYEHAGAALAVIHQCLHLTAAHRKSLPPQLDNASFRCWVHGDYTKTNVGVLAENAGNHVAIIDWQLSDMYGGNGNYGTACFDIGWFVSGIFMEPPHRHLGHWHMRRKALRFLQGYFSETRRMLSLCEVVDYSRSLLRCRRREFAEHARSSKRLLLQPAFWHWARFLDELEEHGTMEMVE